MPVPLLTARIVLFQKGGLLDGHVYALHGLLADLVKLCPRRMNNDCGYRLYVWLYLGFRLYHLLGGEHVKLQHPPDCKGAGEEAESC